MIVGKRVSEDEMILEWLKAELTSKRFRYPQQVDGRNALDLILEPDPSNEDDNRLRRVLLNEKRGYEDRRGIFTGFPIDVAWYEATMTLEDLRKLLYLNEPGWVELTDGSRFVIDGAANVTKSRDEAGIREVAALYASGQSLPRPIVIEHEGRLILLEGCLRATAFALCDRGEPLEVLVGVSPGFGGWYFV